MASVVTQLTELGAYFSGVATADPVSAVLVALGAVLTLGSVAFVGYLAAGAVLDLIVPDRIGRTHRRGA